MSIEKEEEERKELLRMMSGDRSNDGLQRSNSSLSGKIGKKDDDAASVSSISSMVSMVVLKLRSAVGLRILVFCAQGQNIELTPHRNRSSKSE